MDETTLTDFVQSCGKAVPNEVEAAGDKLLELKLRAMAAVDPKMTGEAATLAIHTGFAMPPFWPTL